MSPLAATLVVTALVVAAGVAIMRFLRHRDQHPGEAWWRSSSIWIGVWAVFAILGVFVVPKLLGFTFLFLPFLWVGGLGRRDRDERAPRGDGEARDAA
ncbi:MAG TPA: hypothetical protein VEC15_11980 [Actinomycetota bacterium]|nr:hypothetical protein [Actinomycetota bacterium]